MNREESVPDTYRDWDAAYVLGSLAPRERHEYEVHLAGCPSCAAAVAELAGLPGILAALPAPEALELRDTARQAAAGVPGGGEELAAAPPAERASYGSRQPGAPAELPVTVLSAVAAKVRGRRLRNAVLAGVLALGSAAAATGVTLAVTSPGPSLQLPAAGTPLRFIPATAVPITAVGTIRGVGWGTRIDWTCTYTALGSESSYPQPARPPGTAADPDSQPYELVVTDISGRTTVAASWMAEPGSVVSPTATVALPLQRIRSVEIRWAASGKTALRADLPAGS